MIKSDKLNLLTQAKQSLIKLFDKKEISQDEYNQQMEKLNTNITQEIKGISGMATQESAIKKINKEETGKMAPEVKEEKVKKIKEPKEKKEKKPSFLGVVVKVLSMKTTKNMNNAVAKAIELFPGKDPKKARNQISVVITAVRKGKGKFKNYNWDNENFLLTEKAQ